MPVCRNRSRFCSSLILGMLLTWAGCFSDVKRLDASGLAEDTSVRDAYQPNTWMDVKPSGDSPGDMDGTPGSGGRTGFDANSGDGAGGLHGTGGAGGLHGTGGAGGLVGSGGASSSVDAPLSSGGAGGGTGGSTGTGGGAGTDGAVVDGNKDAGLEVPPPPCQSAKDGTPCGEGMVCSNAQCVPCASGGSCPASNPCHRGIYSCSTGVSVCVDNGNAPDGTDCGSGNVCRSGTCSACVQGGECPLPNSPCRKGILTCTAGVSSCADNGAKPDLTTCDDGNACTTGEACHAGGCNGGTPKTCTASDSCHAAGTCDPATGACSNPVGNEGGACNDGNACSQTDKCQSGQCVGTNPVVCTALDACHGVGTCDTTTGACSNPVANENGTCTDGNACTQTDKCQNGQCVGTNPVVCAALDGCHVAGTCNTANGTCSNPIGNIGSACPLTDPCMKSGLCQSNGSCVGVTKCDSPENCHTAQGATCAAGVCNYPSFGEGATDSNCPPGRQICHSGICAQCINNTNCSGNANGPLCDTSTNNCVQCLSSADCTGSAKSCTPSTHQCVCRLPSDGNILKNPGFNEGSTWWNLEAATIDATYDADGCSGSSGIRTGGGPDPYQCVDVAGGTEFWMGGTFKGMATGYIRAQYYSATSCGGTELGSDQFMYYGAENWSPASGKYETPAAARSVRISISVTYLFCDRLYINTSADRF